MSKHNDEFFVNFTPNFVMDACCEAIANLGWRIMEKNDTKIVCKEVSNVSAVAILVTYPVNIDISISSSKIGTQIVLKGSNFGFGPVQSGHVKGQVGNIRNRIELALNKTKPPESVTQPTQDIAAQIKKLSDLRDQGILSEAEFVAAKTRILGA